MITNESGVTYHYALPAYSYDEFMKSKKIDESQGQAFNSLKKPEKYAYTWYLTAMTGPDYIDSNEDGLVNEGDWGYWVGFDYGLWADAYQWRNPGQGFHQDLDREFENYASGKKELYYLNAIRTETHTALFVKEIRADGKGVTSADEGGFDTLSINELNEICYPDGCEQTFLRYDLRPVSTLKLKGIYLLKNQDITWNTLWSQSTAYTHSESHEIFTETFVYTPHHGENVIDVNDIANIQAEFKARALRVIDFETDYSLARGTANSYFSDIDAEDHSFSPDPGGYRRGKLTLKALTFIGKGGNGIIPPLCFDYELTEEPAHTVIC